MLSDNEAKALWVNVKKKTASMEAEAVAEIAEGRSMQQVADLLGVTKQRVRDMLRHHAIRGVYSNTPLEQGGKSHSNPVAQVNNLWTEYEPEEVSEERIEHYEAAGHTPEVAKLFARGEATREIAIDEGVLVEGKNEADERVSRLVLPAGLEWRTRLVKAMSEVKGAAKLLDNANVNDLKRALTREKVLEAHAKWIEQIELLANYHPELKEIL